jgi:DNA-binding beta-propeller fold protein YncE
MKAKRTIPMALLIAFTMQASAQQSPPVPESSSLILTNAIPLPNEPGRIDHFALDPGGRVFVCIVGNDKVAVVGNSSDKEIYSISVPRPQGAVYVPEFDKLFVGSRDGKLFIFDGTSYKLIGSIDLGGDTDNVRYDQAAKRVYVGHGDGPDAGIAAVDPRTNQRLEEEYKLGAHPESFQLEASGQRIFVNLPDLKRIDVIDRKAGSISKWPMTKYQDNFAMALDERDHRLFVGAKTPARLVVLDTNTGQVVAALPSVADSDDLWYDAEYRRIYMPGGQGYISVFDQMGPDRYKLLEKVPSSLGARTASYAAKIGKKGGHRFFLGVPARSGRDAELWIYQAQESD